MSGTFEDEDWERLLDRIENGHVLPVLGPALSAVAVAGQSVPLQQHLAAPLAQKLKLPSMPPPRTVMDAAREHIGNGGRRDDLYAALRTLYRQPLDISTGLAALAGIDAFKLFISSTPDDLMARALSASDPGFDAQRQVFYFHPNGRSAPHPHPDSEKDKPNCDLPKGFVDRGLYQVMGSLQSTDFAAWEEDYMEFVCGLIEQRGTLERLFHRLKGSDLLLIGAPSEDWIVRFFLRAARGRRLSEDTQNARYYLAENRGAMSAPMMFFFETATKLTRIIDGDPTRFAVELARRWKDRTRPPAAGNVFARVAERCPAGAVFISYGREDSHAAETLGRELIQAGVPFWLDKRELDIGEDWNRRLEAEIKQKCAFFVALVSAATEDPANRERYLHQERRWAATRHVDSFVFYLQVFVDLPPEHVPRQEPPEVSGLQHSTIEEAQHIARRLGRLLEANRKDDRLRH